MTTEFIGKYNEIKRYIRTNGLKPANLEGRDGSCIVCGNSRSVSWYESADGKLVKIVCQANGCNH